MSLAENMLNSISTFNLGENVEYIDEEEHIVVDEFRKITVPKKLQTIAVTGDKDIETVTFDCVRYWDNHDFSTFAIYINYMLPNRTMGTYIPTYVRPMDGNNKYINFEWTIGKEITKYSGGLSFLIVAIKTDGEGNVLYQWSSLINNDCNIPNGIPVTNVPDVEQSTDVISQILASVQNKISNDRISQEIGDSESLIMSQKATTMEINRVENTLETKIFEETSKLQKQITNIEQGIIPDPFETDDSVAYVKDVPSNVLPYAEIAKVGGMTYKDGETLKSAKVMEIESVGANLCKGITAGTNVSVQDGVVTQTQADTATSLGFKTQGYLDSTYYRQIAYKENIAAIGVVSMNFTKTADFNRLRFSTIGKTIESDVWIDASHLVDGVDYTISVNVLNVTQGSFSWKDTMINKGQTALPYVPYQKHTLPIPEAVQVLDGYGDGVDATYYNYIDWENKQFVKRVGEKVLNGTETWYMYNDDLITSAFDGFAPNGTPSLCDSSYEYRMGYGLNKFVVYTNGEHTVESWKAYLAENPLDVKYVMITPETTDISEILTADNFIEVEGNGTITLVNEYGYDVPSEITYMLKGVTA